ncbi:hypothetical protein SAMN04487965_0933 [Microbulbifer donghaiensis]|uniref:Uncharacterized protein n=1 Tax=Microbulbifer donghaiensis TaxID=494016 RepID=A0A1M4XCT1_9GAMM|nr:hypothetical protein [Microbulbifer donghaiensis]SHE91324.1 hypothetical protein SAMN04487965_0933 [Microbulbifer donghaiensis]
MEGIERGNQIESKSETTPVKKKRRTRKVRKYPTCSFEDALALAKAIQKNSGNQKIRRITLFDLISKASESGPSRTWVTNAAKYGLISGSSSSEFLQLTDLGHKVTSDDFSEYEKAKAAISLAVLDVETFNYLYEHFKGNKLPQHAVLIDALEDQEVDSEDRAAVVDTFIVNIEQVGLLKTLSGAQRLIEVDHALEGLSTDGAIQRSTSLPAATGQDYSGIITSGNSYYDSVCFYVTPIGEDGSEQRKHSDLFLGSIIEPAIEQLGLKVVRADGIETPGLITNQVIEYILNARLVVVDLSFSNPNVFYELALRHAARLPTVQVIRKGDKIPFDISQFRTLVLDCTDIYSLVPMLETYKAEVATAARKSIEDCDSLDNPLTSVYPNLRLTK